MTDAWLPFVEGLAFASLERMSIVVLTLAGALLALGIPSDTRPARRGALGPPLAVLAAGAAVLAAVVLVVLRAGPR